MYIATLKDLGGTFMRYVDLNSDIGEGFGNYDTGLDEEIITCISSANIACGFHAGDPVIMDRTVSKCVVANVSIGAHPGYPDLAGFGRRNMEMSEEEITSCIKYQLGALIAYGKTYNARVSHLKPHGAMYNMAAVDYKIAKAISMAIYEVDKEIILVGLANSQLIKAGKDMGLRVAREIFADRAYNDNGTLVSRKVEGAVISDEGLAMDRLVKMLKTGRVTSINGREVEVEADTICVHGDNPKAVEFVRQIRKRLEIEGIAVCPMSEFIK